MNTTPSTLRRTLVLLALSFQLSAFSFFLTGCATGGPVDDSGLIQKVLNQIVPANFEGDLKVDHTGHYFGTTITLNVDLQGLRKTEGRWLWDSGGYTRSGIFSNGGITLTPKPRAPN